MSNETLFDLVGVGVGPANLGLAALLSETEIKHLFFDNKPAFTWHHGVVLAHSDLQVHYLKDLVTMVSPTNRYSFLSFLSQKQRLYQFLNQNKSTVSRKEYEHYYQWVSENLSSLLFDTLVERIDYIDGAFKIQANNVHCYTKHLVMGVGKQPKIPEFAVPHLSDTVLHSHSFSLSNFDSASKTICVVGGGQSAAEIIYTLLHQPKLPAKIYWVNKRYRFLPLEDACLSNEYYTPSYCHYFYQLEKENKHYLNQQLFDTNNGITLSLLNAIYHRIYELKFIDKAPFSLTFLPSNTCHAIEKIAEKYRVTLHNTFEQTESQIEVDQIVLATGYEHQLPALLHSVLPEMPQKNYPVNADFSLPWEHEKTNKIYIQNGAEHCFGLADTNLGVFSWRNATIINSFLKQKRFQINDSSLLLPKHALYSS